MVTSVPMLAAVVAIINAAKALSILSLKRTSVNFSFSAILSSYYFASGFIEAPQFVQIFFNRGTGVLQLEQLNVSTLHGWQ